MKAPGKVVAARIEADRARGQVMASAQALQLRLSPKVLARDAWEGTKSKGADLVEDAVDAVKARPYAATGVAAAIALFLAAGIAGDFGKAEGAEAAQVRGGSRTPVI